MAHNIDLVIILITAYGIGYFIENNLTLFSILLGFFLAYESIFNAGPWAATPGKKIMKIKIIKKNGQKLKLIQAFFRAILKLFSFGIFFIGYIFILIDPYNRGLHDRIIGNFVVFEDKY